MHNMLDTFVRQDLPFLGRDATPEEQARWKRLEDQRELSHARSRSLTVVERQAVTMHIDKLHHSPCWLCGFPQSQYTAARSVEVAYPHPTFHCVRCGIRLKHFLPFVMMGPPWLWARPNDMTLPEVLETVEAHRPVWEDR